MFQQIVFSVTTIIYMPTKVRMGFEQTPFFVDETEFFPILVT
jgi:hypothetical protein